MDFSKYSNIAPYRGKDVDDAIKRVLGHKEELGAFVAMLVGDGDKEAIGKYLSIIMDNIAQ